MLSRSTNNNKKVFKFIRNKYNRNKGTGFILSEDSKTSDQNAKMGKVFHKQLFCIQKQNKTRLCINNSLYFIGNQR